MANPLLKAGDRRARSKEKYLSMQHGLYDGAHQRSENLQATDDTTTGIEGTQMQLGPMMLAVERGAAWRPGARDVVVLVEPFLWAANRQRPARLCFGRCWLDPGIVGDGEPESEGVRRRTTSSTQNTAALCEETGEARCWTRREARGRGRRTVRQAARRALDAQLYSRQEAVRERRNGRRTDGHRPLMAIMVVTVSGRGKE
jgi:hypothetical protein